MLTTADFARTGKLCNIQKLLEYLGIASFIYGRRSWITNTKKADLGLLWICKVNVFKVCLSDYIGLLIYYNSVPFRLRFVRANNKIYYAHTNLFFISTLSVTSVYCYLLCKTIQNQVHNNYVYKTMHKLNSRVLTRPPMDKCRSAAYAHRWRFYYHA